ncbi:hypothetical protein G2W53_008032 [Senna tora]|uniref:Uncharacterized protein n=1 Tax=Senna tora TaxID=362788 RepID=A0A835CGI5_9FABA|nr:hypothetical protein G2W53_008032 [Senna tora]
MLTQLRQHDTLSSTKTREWAQLHPCWRNVASKLHSWSQSPESGRSCTSKLHSWAQSPESGRSCAHDSTTAPLSLTLIPDCWFTMLIGVIEINLKESKCSLQSHRISVLCHLVLLHKMVRTKNVSFDDVGSSKRKARFDDTRFANALAEQRYTKLFSHSATGIHERGLFLDPEGHPNPDQTMSATMDAFDWTEFIKAPAIAGRLAIVQEFYANFSSQDDDKVLVRGKRVPISCEAILAFYKLPPIYAGVHCAYATFTALPEKQIPFDDIRDALRLNEEIGSNRWEKDS